MVIDAVLNVATEMAVDRLVHNSVQFITKNQGYYCPWSFHTFFLSSSLRENVDYFYRVRK